MFESNIRTLGPKSGAAGGDREDESGIDPEIEAPQPKSTEAAIRRMAEGGFI